MKVLKGRTLRLFHFTLIDVSFFFFFLEFIVYNVIRVNGTRETVELSSRHTKFSPNASTRCSITRSRGTYIFPRTSNSDFFTRIFGQIYVYPVYIYHSMEVPFLCFWKFLVIIVFISIIFIYYIYYLELNFYLSDFLIRSHWDQIVNNLFVYSYYIYI